MRKYKNPPVTEVVAEFYFQPSDWDAVLPGMLYERLKGEFPERVKPTGASGIRIGPQGAPQILRPDRIFLSNKDERLLIQLGPNLLALNNVKQYSHWDEFFPSIKKVFTIYKEAAPESQVIRLGLQYINKLAFPTVDGKLELEDYLEFYPFTGPNLPANHGAFNVNVQFHFDEVVTLVQLGNTSFSSPEEFNAILDIKAFSLGDKVLAEQEVYNWLEKAHSNVSTVFEGCINDKTRKIFIPE